MQSAIALKSNPYKDIDIVQLHIRVIALENLMIAAFTGGTENQRSLVRNDRFVVPADGDQ